MYFVYLTRDFLQLTLLREGISDSFTKHGMQVPSSTSPANPESH